VLQIRQVLFDDLADLVADDIEITVRDEIADGRQLLGRRWIFAMLLDPGRQANAGATRQTNPTARPIAPPHSSRQSSMGLKPFMPPHSFEGACSRRRAAVTSSRHALAKKQCAWPGRSSTGVQRLRAAPVGTGEAGLRAGRSSQASRKCFDSFSPCAW
jgi:hypothetical protein